MPNRVMVQLAYNKQVLIDVANLPKLMDILEGANIVGYDYLDNERVDYIEAQGYHLEFKQTYEGTTYMSESQYQITKQQFEDNKAAMVDEEPEAACG